MHARAVSHFASRLCVATFVALFAAACEHNSSGIAGSLATITVDRNPDTLAVRTSRQFTATGRDVNGTIVGIQPVWTVAASGGTVGASGIFTAGTVLGTFASTVVATVGSISGSATATVVAGPPATITLTPTTATVPTGGTQLFVAVVKDAAGNILTTLPNWGTGAGGSINGTGLFTAGNVAGVYLNNVTASVGTIVASASVTVTPAALASITITPNPVVLGTGATQTFSAAGKDVNGNVVAFTPNWAVVAGGGAITAAGGVFTAGTVAGTFGNTVRVCSTAACASGDIAAFATVTVTAGGLAAITVTPNPVNVGTNASQQFTAVGTDAGGNVVPITPAPTWSVAVGHSGGTIGSASGIYTAPGAVGPGFDTVKATSGAISGAARANVIAPAGGLVAVDVSPNPATVIVGATQQFTATGFDANGLIIPTPGLTWSVIAGGGTIDVNGLFTAGLLTGTFPNTVRATSGGNSGYATVNVTATPSVSVGPSLGLAQTMGILAGSAVTCASAPGVINADVGIWPGLAVTGFPPCTLTGNRHVGDSYAQQAQSDLTSAFLALAAMPCGTTITADLGGTTLAPGVYCSGSSVGVTGTVTLNGPATALFVIRAPSTLTTAGNVVLTGGALARNVFWWVGSSATLGNTSSWQGNVIAFTTITLNNGVTMLGRALARNGAVAIGTGTVITLPP